MNIAVRKVCSVWSVPVQKWISVFCCLMMMVGLLYARAILSISIIVFVANAFHPLIIKKYWWQAAQNGFVILCMMFFAGYLISGFWSRDTLVWMNELILKLPFLLFPLAFFSTPVKEKKYATFLIGGFLLILLSGVIYSLSISDLSSGVQGAHVHIRSAVGGDYLRFSMVLLMGVLVSLYLLFEKTRLLSTFKKCFLIIWILFISIYLHMLAAKSGVLFLYLIISVFVGYKLYQYKKIWVPIGLGIIFLIGSIVVFKVPLVRAQVSNMVYEIKAWNNNDMADMDKQQRSYMSRMMSYVIAFDIIKEKPLTGVGAGDFMKTVKARYDAFYPYVLKQDRVVPHNQLLATMVTVGIPLSIIFLILFIYPLMFGGKYQLYYLLNYMILSGFMLFEAVLEIQHGIFVFLFFNMFWVRLLGDENKKVLILKWPSWNMRAIRYLPKYLIDSNLYNNLYRVESKSWSEKQS